MQRTGPLDIDEINVVSGGVHHSPKCHRVSNLTMEPYVFIGGEEPGEVRANDTNDVTKHGEEYQTTVVGKNEASSTRRPHRPFERVETG